MARIIYGINGEGMGHAMRSKPVLEYLSKRHQVRIFASSRAYGFLSKTFPVHKIQYYPLIYVNNKVSYLLTFILGLLRTPFLAIYNCKVAYYMIKDRPDIAISDFEPAVIYWANILRIPVVNIDNQHTITGTKIRVMEDHKSAYIATRRVIRFIVPRADAYISTTFFYEKKTMKNLFLVPPILRDEIRSLKSGKGKHVLVYQTSKSSKELLPVLKSVNERFIVYGWGDREKEGNVEFRGLDERQFYRDLAGCKAIVTNGGFTLIGEALYLRKPIFCHVIGNQFEQQLNGYYVEKLGYGVFRDELKREYVIKFLGDIKKYRKNLKKFKREDNSKLFRILDKLISEYLVADNSRL